VQEQVFDRKKLESLITTSIDAYPKKQLFYKYLMKYMSKVFEFILYIVLKS